MAREKSTDILFAGSGKSSTQGEEVREKKSAKVDIHRERLILSCAIGCITKDMPLSDADILRMHLALTRLISFHKNSERLDGN